VLDIGGLFSAAILYSLTLFEVLSAKGI